VLIAITGKGYCRSTYKAFNAIADNPLKFAITDGISVFFTTLGILGISIGVAIGVYIVCIKVQYFAIILTSPLIVTIAGWLIALIISAIYLSMIDISALSIMQSYLYEH
jgi:choline transporter-like protein 2/4/5